MTNRVTCQARKNQTDQQENEVFMNEVLESTKLHQHLDLDSDKRHFVFGDIHGRYTTFQRLLDAISYDSTTDVIYSVGDMIDRGPDSVSVVKFFQNEHCHAILGNHEHMAMCPSHWEDVWLFPPNGGPATLHSLEQHGYDLQWLTRHCASLPVCLDVGDESHPNAFRLLHAESPFHLSEQMLINYLSQLPRDEISESDLIWGRSDITQIFNTTMACKSLDTIAIADDRSARKVFCGHTPIENVVSAHNVYWIDTFASNLMTCINPVNLDIHQVAIEPVDQ